MTIPTRPARPLTRLLLLAIAGVLALPAAAEAGGRRRGPRYCTQTARIQTQACAAESRDDYLIARVACLNIGDDEERKACESEARSDLRDAWEQCDDVTDARLDLCDLVGEERYEPDFDPARFDDPKNPSHPNPWFPLEVGQHWTYAEGEEQVDVEVLDKTKRIEGVTCLVVRDVVSADGLPIEDTNDWFATHQNGDIYYCGEEVKDYETFAGDDPEEPELVSTEGSFKAGVDGAKAGILFPGDPQPGRTDRQEWSPSNAEDAATVVTKTYRYGDRAELDVLVPQALAELLCTNADCVVTKEFTPIEPDTFAYKYYARGVGRFLEVNPGEGTTVQLFECNVDPLCASLPEP